MNTSIEEFVSGKRIAVAGASRSGKKFGNIAAKELKTRGYEVYLIHPEAKEIDGLPCYPDLAALPARVDGLFVSLPANRSGQVIRQAAEIGVRNVWLQQGAENAELLTLGQELGLNLVSGKCILMYAPPVRSFHRWHRAVVRLTGGL
ncbi:MAG TPA: CoA-binding protein [Anaerolineales bacterium]|nr:CoA-binding protein [Anaerolineales bacterium]